MSNELKELIKTKNELYNKGIYPYKLQIIEELECQAVEKLPDAEFSKLYYEIEYAYLKLEGVSIENITRCALVNKEKIINDSDDFNLREESCWY